MMKEKIEKELREEKMIGKLDLQWIAVPMSKTSVPLPLCMISVKLQTERQGERQADKNLENDRL
jgi:hypothetical protein